MSRPYNIACSTQYLMDLQLTYRKLSDFQETAQWHPIPDFISVTMADRYTPLRTLTISTFNVYFSTVSPPHFIGFLHEPITLMLTM